jgi:hypothetical protein
LEKSSWIEAEQNFRPSYVWAGKFLFILLDGCSFILILAYFCIFKNKLLWEHTLYYAIKGCGCPPLLGVQFFLYKRICKALRYQSQFSCMLICLFFPVANLMMTLLDWNMQLICEPIYCVLTGFNLFVWLSENTVGMSK